MSDLALRFIVFFIAGVGLWVLFLLVTLWLFNRRLRMTIEQRAAFQARLRKHVLRNS